MKRWDTEDGLPENGARALLQTRDGYLWIGTTLGLVRFDGLRFTVFHGVATYVYPDTPMATRLHDGTVLFATAIGVAAISPRDIHVNPEPPAVVIESVLADGELIAFEEQNGIVIPPRTSRIEIQFTAPSLAAPERQRFRNGRSPRGAGEEADQHAVVRQFPD